MAKRKRRATKGKGKGSAFERKVCKQLSLWWSHNATDHVFWRTSNSGGRATVRSKSKKTTAGHYGDITAVNPIGQPLMDVCTIECKTGYGQHSPMDLIDSQPGKQTTYGKFFAQALAERDAAGVPYWMLIARRKGKAIMVYLPLILYVQLLNIRASEIPPHFYVTCTLTGDKTEEVVGLKMDTFVKGMRPEPFCLLADHVRKRHGHSKRSSKQT